jgi:glyoxylase-like metal-dependent hydrolase (beta-lactamase superfamily II)
MKTTIHGKNLIKLTRMGMFNCYLIREDDGFTLIDTCNPSSEKAILAEAQKHGTPIVRIALTHAHVDHVGSLDALKQALPDAEVIITTREARFMAGDTSLDPDEPQDQLRGGYPTCETKPTHLIESGEQIGSLEVVASPGHTPGHAAFFDTRDKTLIAGDAFQTQAGIAVAGVMRWLFPFPAMATWHKPTALESAKALRALDPARLVVGHGKVIEDPQSAMDRAIEEAQRKFNT